MDSSVRVTIQDLKLRTPRDLDELRRAWMTILGEECPAETEPLTGPQFLFALTFSLFCNLKLPSSLALGRLRPLLPPPSTPEAAANDIALAVHLADRAFFALVAADGAEPPQYYSLLTGARAPVGTEIGESLAYNLGVLARRQLGELQRA